MSIFSYFNRKKAEKEEQNKLVELVRTTEIGYKDPAQIEVGKTIVRLSFENKRILNKVIYGQVYQYVSHGNDSSNSYGRRVEEPRVGEIAVTPSKTQAVYFISSLGNGEGTFTNDDNIDNIIESVIGKVIHARILKSYEHNISFNEAIVVPKKQK